MKIAKIISIMKTFTNFPLPFQAAILPRSGSFFPLCGVLHPIGSGGEFGVAGPCRLSLGPVLARRSPGGQRANRPHTNDHPSRTQRKMKMAGVGGAAVPGRLSVAGPEARPTGYFSTKLRP